MERDQHASTPVTADYERRRIDWAEYDGGWGWLEEALLRLGFEDDDRGLVFEVVERMIRDRAQ